MSSVRPPEYRSDKLTEAELAIPDEEEKRLFHNPDFQMSQDFFTHDCATRLAAVLNARGYLNPCCLCTPRLAYVWWKRFHRPVRLLDIDEVRFSLLPGFRRFDINAPSCLDESFDVIITDLPTFSELALPLIRKVVDQLAAGKKPDLFLVWDENSEPSLLQTFSDYGLRRTEFRLEHCYVKPCSQSRFPLYGNVDLSGA